jgi:hypothetical protein
MTQPSSKTAMSKGMHVRQWLRANDYGKVADLIDDIIEGWSKAGKSTRRNWWKILAGDADGKPCIVSGKKFPVLRAAQIRQGVLVTPNSIFRSPTEHAPPTRKSNRWPSNKRRRKKA